MKKVLLFSLIFISFLSFIACGENDGSSENGDAVKTDQDQLSETKNDSDQGSEITEIETITKIQEGKLALGTPVLLNKAVIISNVVKKMDGEIPGYSFYVLAQEGEEQISIYVFNGESDEDLYMGDLVKIDGSVGEHKKQRQISTPLITKIGTEELKTSQIETTTADLSDETKLNSFRGKIVTVKDETVAEATDKFGSFEIGNGVVVSEKFLEEGTFKNVSVENKYSVITGIFDMAFNIPTIYPLESSDVCEKE